VPLLSLRKRRRTSSRCASVSRVAADLVAGHQRLRAVGEARDDGRRALGSALGEQALDKFIVRAFDEHLHAPAAGETHFPGALVGDAEFEQARLAVGDGGLRLADDGALDAAAGDRADEGAARLDREMAALRPRRGTPGLHHGGQRHALAGGAPAAQLREEFFVGDLRRNASSLSRWREGWAEGGPTVAPLPRRLPMPVWMPVAAVLADGVDQRCNPLPAGRHRAQHLVPSSRLRWRNCMAVVRSSTVRSACGRSALFTTSRSAISMMPALMACTSSPSPGGQTTMLLSAKVADLHFRLAGADRLDDHHLEADGVEDVDDASGVQRQAAEVAARGHRADEDLVARAVLVHAQAVAEDGAAADRAGRIDGDDGDAAPALREFADQGVDEGGLAGARRPGDADDVGAAAARRQFGHQFGRARRSFSSRVMARARGRPGPIQDSRMSIPVVSSSPPGIAVHYCAFMDLLMQYVAAFDHIMLYIEPFPTRRHGH
jgi:hypothetical protein